MYEKTGFRVLFLLYIYGVLNKTAEKPKNSF